ncbi:MAG TPA: gliding motility lipoprotein GldD [Bacteroidales bacterium]|nr:gliding motility lipoprotein GldD [Bacteroidales bacterium]
MKPTVIFLVMLVFLSCQQPHTPKPRAYFRIDLPEKEYNTFDADFPYSFEIPVYGSLMPQAGTNSLPYWADIVFPEFRATIHLTYKAVANMHNLNTLMEDSREFASRHIPKATAINEEMIFDEQRRVFGVLYQIQGKDVASPLQFFVTDSLNHFLRGSLYFNVTPNNDSLAPVIRFLEYDIRHILETLHWE